MARCGLIGVLATCLLALAMGTADAKKGLRTDTKPHRGVSRAHKMPVQGIDVSKWQGDIDWRKVQAAGVQFAYIKATEGGDHIDPKFHQNWRGAKRAGVLRGAYHFVYWCRPAHEQALWFVLNVPSDPDALPPVLDVEWNAHSKTCPSRISPARARAKIEVLLDAMRAHTGKEPIIYTDITFHKQVLQGRLRDRNFWLRSVAAEPRKVYRDRPWLFWQFTTTGRVNGIQGTVDRNVFNGRPADWNYTLQRMQAGRR
jgi:lysozyme